MSNRKRIKDIAIEDAHIMFRNFSGEEGQFNRKGDRNFCVFLDNDEAERLEVEGWNIKYLTARDEEEEDQAYVQVSASYTNIPPKIVMISGQGQTLLDESTVGMLDWVDIAYADLIINPYSWEVNGKVGIKAYVKALYVTIEEDEFANKYYDEPAVPTDSLPTSLDINGTHKI